MNSMAFCHARAPVTFLDFSTLPLAAISFVSFDLANAALLPQFAVRAHPGHHTLFDQLAVQTRLRPPGCGAEFASRAARADASCTAQVSFGGMSLRFSVRHKKIDIGPRLLYIVYVQ
jgi:hypothetical protein